jgi:hypothetical protein
MLVQGTSEDNEGNQLALNRLLDLVISDTGHQGSFLAYMNAIEMYLVHLKRASNDIGHLSQTLNVTLLQKPFKFGIPSPSVVLRISQICLGLFTMPLGNSEASEVLRFRRCIPKLASLEESLDFSQLIEALKSLSFSNNDAAEAFAFILNWI